MLLSTFVDKHQAITLRMRDGALLVTVRGMSFNTLREIRDAVRSSAHAEPAVPVQSADVPVPELDPEYLKQLATWNVLLQFATCAVAIGAECEIKSGPDTKPERAKFADAKDKSAWVQQAAADFGAVFNPAEIGQINDAMEVCQGDREADEEEKKRFGLLKTPAA